MLIAASVESVEVGPDRLRVALGGPRLPAVAVHRPDWPERSGRSERHGGLVEFRILAASHQVVVEDPGTPRHVETVACGLAAGRPLRHGATHAAGRWTMAATVDRVDPVTFAEHAAAWRRRGRRDRGVIVVRFPSHPDALTALAVEEDGWVGVHTYPDETYPDEPAGAGGTIVVTRTRRVGAPEVAPESQERATCPG